MGYQQAYNEIRSFDRDSEMRPEMIPITKLAKSDHSPSPMGGFGSPYTIQQHPKKGFVFSGREYDT